MLVPNAISGSPTANKTKPGGGGKKSGKLGKTHRVRGRAGGPTDSAGATPVEGAKRFLHDVKLAKVRGGSKGELDFLMTKLVEPMRAVVNDGTKPPVRCSLSPSAAQAARRVPP